MHQNVFQLHQPRKMLAERKIAPRQRLAQLTLRDSDLRARYFDVLATKRDVIVQEDQQLSCLRKQAVQTLAHRLAGQAASQLNIFDRGNEPFFPIGAGICLALVLVQEGDRGDKCKMFGWSRRILT